MGVFDRLRGVRTLEDATQVIREETVHQRPLRVLLSENKKRITDTFSQRLPNVVERATNGELTVEAGGSVPAIVTAKVDAKMGATSKVEVTPLMQVLMLEEAASSESWPTELRDRDGQRGDSLLR